MAALLVCCLLATAGLAGCAPGDTVSPTRSRAIAPGATLSPSVSTSPSPTPLPSASSDPGSVPPPWLGTRPLPTDAAGFGEVRPTPPRLRHRAFTLPDSVAELPGHGFTSRILSPAPASVIARSTWQPGCPVAASDLAWIRLAFWGFDHIRHTGELLVNAAAANDVVQVFTELYRARFPIEQMTITTRPELDAEPTGDGNDTESFVCRPVRGSTVLSQHAYGLAVDLDPFQNPYAKDVDGVRRVLPELASSYLDRGDLRPGMITPSGPVFAAFARIGWGWGGAWNSLRDYQHFSANGR
ncbi:M15 family metallopeptidase [Nocardioides acrostichi]|uniref:M15 family metallopeptidase n=1 Tax=Nocardioides acrostichi TaxID=2784339 RepID=A0A930UZD2_9ACTN|nr:M15 family metallopeptidase [Nocardioides acrostichi]MBF4161189.1 M15 family metallopeptidase [Nocardioides acrostichi]